jgi:hypothetical protein
MSVLLEQVRELGVDFAPAPAEMLHRLVGLRFAEDELVSDAVLGGFPGFRNSGPLKCGETTGAGTHSVRAHISRSRAHLNCEGGQ